MFSVSADGSVRTRAALDHETQAQYVLDVSVQDNGFPSYSSTAQLTVLVEDVNDHPPRSVAFTQQTNVLRHQQLVCLFLRRVNLVVEPVHDYGTRVLSQPTHPYLIHTLVSGSWWIVTKAQSKKTTTTRNPTNSSKWSATESRQTMLVVTILLA